MSDRGASVVSSKRRGRSQVLAGSQLRRRKSRVPWWIVLLPVLCCGSYLQLHTWLVKPQAVLVLGGETSREKFAAKFAQEHPHLPIWISSGAPREYTEWVFSEAGIALNRIHLDYRAVDTLTNFTTLVDDLKAKGITNVYLITSDYHMRRANLIGEIVLGSRGMTFRPIEIQSNPPRPEESLIKALRDGGRALIWLGTGYTGTDLKQEFEPPPHPAAPYPSPRSHSG